MWPFDSLGRGQWVAIGAIGGASLLMTTSVWYLGLIAAVLGVFGLLRAPVSRRRDDILSDHRLITDGGERDIEMITAVIRPGKLNAVKQSLVAAGAPSLTVSNVSGRGTQPTETGQWRGEEYIVDLHQKVKVEVVVPEEKTEDVVAAIQDAAHTGEPGDGKIWILPVLDAVRVSTEEHGPEAI